MLRTLLLFLCAVPYCLAGLLIKLIGRLIRFRSERAADRLTFSFIHIGAILALPVCGTRVTAEGLENLPENRPVVYVLNHRSIFDIMIAYRYIKSPTGFIAKKELEKVPVLSGWMKLCHCLFLDRSDIREGARIIAAGVENLKAGISMGVFPEGTRNRDQKDRTSLLPFHGGSFKLATRTDLPVIPVVLYNTSACLEDHFPRIRKAEVKVSFGKPIEVRELSPEEKRFLPETVRKQMQKMLTELNS